jgi:hypothetical protein
MTKKAGTGTADPRATATFDIWSNLGIIKAQSSFQPARAITTTRYLTHVLLHVALASVHPLFSDLTSRFVTWTILIHYLTALFLGLLQTLGSARRRRMSQGLALQEKAYAISSETH